MDARALGGGAGPGAGPGAGAPDEPRAVAGLDPEELLEGLNPPQREAVTHGEGPLLILAGAGSGKTRVITRRVAWLVASGRAAPHELLAITFTNKAAREMRERVEAVLPTGGAWIATFHATCARILRREIDVLGGWTRSFSIYDTHDRNQLIKRIVKDLGYDPQRFRPALLGGWISKVKSSAYDRQEDALPEELGHGGVDDEVFVRVRERYDRAMLESNALDFDDLQLKVLEIFERHPGIRDAYAQRFRYVLVDEYQDTNRIQYLLTRHLADWHGNLAVCGDPDQSIYGWRGADIGNILQFETDFGTPQRPVRVVKLEQNYRSTPTILKAAQGLIRHNLGRKEKDLWSERQDQHLVRVVECGDENDEANRIALEIHELLRSGYTADQVAVLFRVNFMQRALERALRLSGIPYQVVGGVEFYARREVRDLLGYLQLVVNPRDDVACQRVLNVPARGVGERSVAALVEWARERGTSLLEAARDPEARATIRGRARAGIAAFAALVEGLADLADQPAEAVLARVIDQVDYLAWLAALEEGDAAGRVENVEELLTHARGYDEEHPEGGLRGFLQDVALVSDVDGWDPEGARVTLMTLHSSKGLEFPVVIVAGMEEELLPHALALVEAGPDEAGVEEERRLLYVGMTRAKDRLLLTHARTRLHFGESSWRRPSRFLEEIPAELVEGAGAQGAEADPFGDYQPPADEAEALCEGDTVEHDHFGVGKVTRLQGAGANARATVTFRRFGSKVLLVQYAKLRVLDR